MGYRSCCVSLGDGARCLLRDAKVMMSTPTRQRAINLSIFVIVYGYLLTSLFDNQPNAQRGGARGMVFGIPLVLIIIAVLTIYYTRTSGGDWKRVRKNLKHNFLGMLSFGWKDVK